MSKGKVETVKVELEVPKPVYEFYEAYAHFMREDLKKLLEEELVSAAGSILNLFEDASYLKKAYGLEKWVK
ncbi:MAG: hypothetical protein ACXQTQ_05605 [Candidatus Hecatellaceae archaeon]